jgi:hypothetical protein
MVEVQAGSMPDGASQEWTEAKGRAGLEMLPAVQPRRRASASEAEGRAGLEMLPAV